MKRYLTRKTLIFALVALLAVGGGAFAYIRLRHDDTPPRSQDEINYGPPTEQEKEAGDKKKQEIVEEEKQPATPPATATVVIVDASQYDDGVEVRAFVSNVIKDGTCTITFTQGSASVVKEVPAYKNATTTQCINLTVPRSEFATAGAWSVTVKYQAAGVSGQAQQTLQLQ